MLYTRYPNELMDALFSLSPRAQSIVSCVVRFTVGWQKREARITYAEFRSFTGLNSDATISRAIAEAQEKGFIAVRKDGRAVFYALRTSSKNEEISNTISSKNEEISNTTSSKNEEISNTTSSKNEEIISGRKKEDIKEIKKENIFSLSSKNEEEDSSLSAGNLQEEEPAGMAQMIAELREYFSAKTGHAMLGSFTSAQVGWTYPLEEIIKLADWKLPEAKKLISAAIDKNHELGYAVVRPYSILNTAKIIKQEGSAKRILFEI